MIENHVLPSLSSKQLRSVTRNDVQKLYNRLKRTKVMSHGQEGDRNLADPTVRRIHMMLHEALEAAVRARLISQNPTEGTTVPKCNYPPMKILNEEQLDRFMEAIKEEPMWYDFFYTEITTGLRRGEICGLQWDDLDETTGKLKVRRSIRVAPGGVLEVGETKTEKGDSKHPSAAQHPESAFRAAKKGGDRVDFPEPAGAGKADFAQRGLPAAEGHSQGRGAAGHPVP